MSERARSRRPRTCTRGGKRAGCLVVRDWQNLVLRACTAPSHDRTWVLPAMTERRVNVSAQQHRALNLAAALLAVGRLDGNPRVGVVGSGVGGFTFAVAAAQQGAVVELFEEHEEPVAAQRAARHRPLHPSVYDWPVPGCTVRDAGVGFCNWVGGSAASMRRQVVGSGLADLAALREPLKFWRQSVVLAVDESEAGDTAESVTVRFTRLAGLVGAPRGGSEDLVELSLDFDLVVIATGYGVEYRWPIAAGHSAFHASGCLSRVMASGVAGDSAAGGTGGRRMKRSGVAA